MSVPERTSEAPIDSMFIERWSPRAFSTRPLSDQIVRSLFEAARWAPSCFNAQPWLFAYAVSESGRAKIAGVLVPQNQIWAAKAPLLIIVFARRNFAHNGKPNAWHSFDAGAAWMSLALQAHKLGLVAHAMAGFDPEKAYSALAVDKEQYAAIAAVAVGYHGDPAELPAPLREREVPSGRSAISEKLLLIE
jgi:nitroreductase